MNKYVDQIYPRRFRMPEQKKIIEYLNSINFIGYYKNGISAIDQKCTFDILHLNSKCILNLLKNNKNEFGIKDFLENSYVYEIYKNKTLSNGKAVIRNGTYNEYDKVIGNILQTLSYAEVLEKCYSKRSNKYTCKNREILELLATSEDACVAFICHFVWLLIKDDFRIMNSIEKLKEDKYNENLKKEFKNSTIKWITNNSKRNKDSSQISQKINNPLFYIYKFGKYSGNKNTKWIEQGIKDLAYFRIHRRDKNKLHGLTRNENYKFNFSKEINKDNWNKIKNQVLKENKKYYSIINNNNQEKNFSEWNYELCEALDVHHIRPRSFWDPKKENNWLHQDIFENLIVLTKNEHYGKAHLKNNTKQINEKELPLILLSQYKKIRILNELNMNSLYNIKKFYSLCCLILNIPENNEFKKLTEKDTIYRYIEDLLL